MKRYPNLLVFRMYAYQLIDFVKFFNSKFNNKNI